MFNYVYEIKKIINTSLISVVCKTGYIYNCSRNHFENIYFRKLYLINMGNFI